MLFAHWSDCVDRNDKVFTFLLYKIVLHKKISHPYEIQNTIHILDFSRLAHPNDYNLWSDKLPPTLGASEIQDYRR